MANEIDLSQFVPDEPAAGQAAPTTDWSQFTPDPPKEPPGLIRKLADLGLDYTQGGAGVLGAAASGLFGAPDPEGFVSGRKNILEANPIGYGMQEVSKYAMELQSDERKAERASQAARMQAAEDTGSKWAEFQAGAQNFADSPGSFMASAVGSMIPTVAAGMLTGGVAVPAALGGVISAGSAREQVAERIRREGAKAGLTPEQAAIQADEAQKYTGENWDQLALAAVLGVAAGGTGIERFVGGGAPIKNMIGRALMGSVTEAIPEAAQGGQERLAANLAAQRQGYGGEAWTGVVGQATTEALASAGPGGVMAALNPAAGPISRAAIQAQQQQAAGALPAPGQLSGDAAIQAGDGMPQADPSQDYELERQKTEREGARRQEESRRAVEDLSYLDQLNGWAPGSALNGAVERLAELEQATQGTPDQQVVGEDGQATVVPGTAPRDLTPEEVAEYDALSVAVENTRRIQETRAGSEPTQDMAAPAGQQDMAAPAGQQDPALPFTQPPYDGPSPTVGDPEARGVDPRVATAGEPIADPAVQLDVDRPTMRQQYLDAQRKRARGELLSQQEAGVLNGPDPFEGQSLSLASPTDEISTNARQEAIEDVAFANDDNPADVSVYSAQDLPDVATRNERGAGLTREAATVIEGLGRIFGTEYRFYEAPSASQRGDGFVLRGRRPDVAYIRATEGDAAPLVVAGHETYHILSQAEKARFSKAIEPYVDTSDLVQLAFLSDYTGGKYKANIEALIRTGMDPAKALDTILVQAEADGIQGLTRAKIREEFDADIFGNRMKDTEFWNKVFNELKAQDRTLLVKIRDSIKQAITYLRKQAGKVRGFDTDQYIRDLDAVQQIAARALLSRAGGKTRSEPGSLDPDSVVRSTPRERVGPYSTETLATMNQNWYAKKGVQYNIEQTPEGFFLAPAGEANEAGRMDQGRDAGTAPDARADGLEAGRADRQDRTPGRDQQAADEGRVAPADTSGVRSSEAGTVSLSAVHFSREPRQVLDGRFYGTGLKGAEARRLAGEPDKRLLDRVYAYVNEGKGIKPESGVGSYPHQLDLSNLYDFAADPLGLRIEHRGNLNGLESAILDQGFNGYYVKGAFGNQGAAVVMGDASHSITPKVEVVRSAPRTIAKENQMSVTVGGKPGEFGWSPAAKMAAESALQDYIALDMFPKTPKAGKKKKTETDPADALVVDPKKLTGTTVPPFIGPTQYKPDLVVVGEAVRKVLATKQARSVLEDLTGAKITGVTQIAGSWGGKPEPSFILTGDMTFEQANDVSKVLGVFVAQDAVVAAQPWLEETEDQTSAVLISQNKVMTPEQVQALSRAATEVGLDYSTTADGKGAKFLNFDGDAALEALTNKARSIAEAAGLSDVTGFHVRSVLNEAETYFERSDGSDLRQTWREDGGTGPSDLFRRAVDHILVPYAKAVGAQGYRLSPDRFGDKFGLTEPEVEYIRSTLRPKSGKALSTVPVLTGDEVLSPPRSNTTRKIPKTTKNDLLWALQNRAAEIGFIEPGDYSPEARKIIAEGMAEEVIHALSTPEGQSAVGWYDRALHKAKAIYEKVFPELREHADSEMMFDAFLGIASQGNDVGSNATFAGRMYYLTTRKGMTISEAVEVLYGTFSKETRAVENNFLKLEDLINRNGMDTMRAFFNKKGTVASINAELRRRKELYDRDGTPLEVEGQADQIVNGWMVFGPKIGSFINNLHGDYSTLTADLWFSRTWNRMLGYVFRQNSELESQQYIKLYRAMLAEARSGTGLDVVGKSQYEIEQIANDPESMIEFAEQVHTRREKEYASLKEEAVTPVRQAAKALVMTRLESVAAPRTDLERAFQQNTVEQVQRIVKRKTGTELTIADIQAVVWYHEKDLFKKYGVGDSRAEKADYADAAAKFVTRYNEGDLFYVEKPKPRYVWGEKGTYLGDDIARSARRAQTQTPAFKKWFGDSKAVELVNPETGLPVESSKEQGVLVPQVMYHTTRKDFSVFEANRPTTNSGTFGDWETTRAAIFVTPDLEASESYGKSGGKFVKDARVMPVFIRAENPLDFTGGVISDQVADQFDSVGLSSRWLYNFDWSKFDDEDGKHFVEAAKRLGYDSVIFNDENPETLESFEAWAIFDPTQIKSAVGNDGNFDGTNPDIRRSSRRNSMGFYSQLQRAVEDAKFQVQPAGQWKSWLKANAGKVGVKADEIQWSGITDWLDLQGTNKVTKEAVSAYLAEGGVRVEEVTKGDIPAARLSAMMEAEGLDLDARARMSDREKSEWLKARNLAPSYGKWRTPGGGTNYREVLLTLPVKTQPGAPQPVRPRVVDAGPDANGRGVFNVVRGDAVLDTFTTWSEATDFAYGVFENESIQFNLDREAKAPKTYKSGHWEEKNVLAHIRLDDRAGPEGEHILFVQELQSDWAQDGRKKGFKPNTPAPEAPLTFADPAHGGRVTVGSRLKQSEAATAELPALRESAIVEIKAAYAKMGVDVTTNEKAALTLADESRWPYFVEMMLAENTPAVSAYFDKKRSAAWFEKEATRLRDLYAAQVEDVRRSMVPAAPFVTDTKAWTALGLKRIITMAAEQGYDQVALVSGAQAAEMFQLDKQVEQISYNKGSKFLRVLDKDGDTIINGSKNPEELPDLLGKEIAERIMATEGNFVQLEGEGLKIEATGMRGFYDKIVPQVANDVLKKLGGGKVTQIQTESWNDAKWGDLADGTREFQTQLGFDITPAMREKVKTDGLPLFSTRRAEKAFGTITAAQEAALRATGLLREPKTIRERFDELTDNAMKRLVQGTVDQYAPLRELDFRAYVLSRMSKGSDGTFEAMLRFGKPVVNGDTIQVDTDAGGLMDVLSSLSGEQDRFLAWIAANRAEQLTNEGKEFLFTPAQITDLKQLNAGAMADGRSRPIEYGRVLKEFNAFQDSVLAIAEARGLIDAESRQVWKDAFYVPFYRNMEDGTTGPSVKSGLVNQYAFKKLKGSQRQLNEDLLANTLQNMAHLLSASAKNHAASASLRAAESAGVAHRVPSGTKGAVRFLDAGREQHYLVDDPFILDAITSLESVKVVGLEKVLSKFKHYLTLGVTVNPTFQIRSLMRDMLSALAITNIKLNPIANVIQGIGSQLRQDQDYINALASGGLIRFNSLVEGNRADYTRKLIRQGVRDSSILDTQEKITGFFSSTLDKWMAVGDIGESTNRMALYKQQIAAGADPLLAAYQARDMMDFSMQGQWRAIRFLTQVVPFLNARMQGLYKLGRDGVVPTGRVLFGGGSATDKQIAKRFGAVTGAVAMASILLMMSFKDDEDWQKREDWDRDTYWWFKHDGIAYRIPKPFEVGAIGTIAERTAELFMDDEMNGARFGQRLGHMMSSTFALNPIPQMIKPLLDVYSNEESFTRRPIETMGMERLQAKDRYTGSTSELAKWLGQVGLPEPGRLMAGQYSALSPVQIDALIRGYFSWLGVSATKIMDEGVRLVADRPERPSMQLRDAFMVGNFAETLPANASRYVTTLYHQSLAIEEAYASYRSALRTGNPARASELLANEGDQIRMQPMVSKAKRALAQLNENIRQIERSRTMSAGEKRAQIDRIKAIQNGIAMRATRAMEG